MSFISVIRFTILKNPLEEKQITLNKSFKFCIISTLMSLFWAGAPALGWSFYSLEDSFVSCSVEYNEKSFSVISYNIGMFVFIFIIPFSIILYTSFKSLFIVRFLKILLSLNRVFIIFLYLKRSKAKKNTP